MGQFKSCSSQLIGGNQHIQHAHRQCFFTLDTTSGIQHQIGILLTHQRGQRVSQAKTGMKAQQRKVGAEARFRATHAKIRHQRQTQAATNGSTLNGANNRLTGVKQAYRLIVEMALTLVRDNFLP